MSTPEETMYQEVLVHIQRKENSRARDLLTRLIKINPNNPQYWLWMSAVTDTMRERIFCLKEALRLDPHNEAAQRGLAMFGAIPVNPDLVVPFQQQKRRWESRLAKIEPQVEKLISINSWRQLLPYAGAAVLVVVLALVSIWGVRSIFNAMPKPAQIDLGPTNTYAPTLTKAVDTSGMTLMPQGQPTPLWRLLKATYTATPVYIATPHSSEAYSIALRSIDIGDLPKALTYIKQAISLEPKSADLYYVQGEIQRQQGNSGEALKSYNQALQLLSSFAPAYLGMARLAINSNPPRWKDAKDDLTKAITLDPNLKEAVLELVNLYLEQNDPQSALDQLSQSADQIKDSPLFYLYRAQAELQLSQPDQAVADASQANQMDITFLPSYRLLGEALMAANRPAEASTPLSVYIQFTPNDAEAWVWLGESYGAQQDVEDALKAFDKALSLNKNLFDAYLQRGRIYLDRKDGDNANSDLSMAVRLNPKSFRANIDLGRAFMLQGIYGNAWKQFATAEAFITSDSEKAEFLYWRGQSLDKLNKPDEAILDYRALLALPNASVQPDWAAFATQRIAALLTNTPQPATPTLTPTPSVTSGKVTSTPRPSDTKWPTRTPKPGPSTPTPSLTPVTQTITQTK
jgi:tetratricopeptide (TPR) repeat protein